MSKNTLELALAARLANPVAGRATLTKINGALCISFPPAAGMKRCTMSIVGDEIDLMHDPRDAVVDAPSVDVDEAPEVEQGESEETSEQSTDDAVSDASKDQNHRQNRKNKRR